MDDSLYKSDLIDLQEIDTKIDSLLIEKESSDRVESLKHGEQEYKALQNRLKKVSDSLTPYRERLDNYEETLEKQHLNLENNMESQSKTNVPSELTNYIAQQEELERNIKKIEGEIELLRDEFSEPLEEDMDIGNEISSLKEQLISESKLVMKLWEQIDKKIASLQKEKEEMEISIPKKYLERYIELRKTEKVVIGYLNEDQCGICGFIFSSNEISKIENKEEDQCPSCRGILI